MMTVNKIRVRNLAEAGLSHAVVLEKILSNQPKMLSAILIGNNIVNISASSLMTVLVTDVLGNKYVGIGTGVLTLLVLIFGEITPKTSATIYSETLSLKFAKPIYLIMQVLTPLIVVVDGLSKGVLKMIHVDLNKKQDAITEDELRTIVEVSHEEGVIESDEKKMIYNVFDFGDSVAKDIMVPRIDMTFLDVNASYQEIMDIFRQEKYTRYPVYEETTDNVIGIVNIKDLFLIPKERFKSRKNYWFHVVCAGAVILILSFGWLAIASRYLCESQPGVDTAAQLVGILKDPAAFVLTFVRSLDNFGVTYLTEMIGSNLGWLNIPVCALLAMGYLLILVLQVSGNDDMSGIRLDLPVKSILGGVSLLVFALIFVTLYGQWTAYGYDKILGVQGRYFLPLLFPLILALKPKRFAEGAGETPWGLFLGAWSIDLCVYATLFVQALCRFA